MRKSTAIYCILVMVIACWLGVQKSKAQNQPLDTTLYPVKTVAGTNGTFTALDSTGTFSLLRFRSGVGTTILSGSLTVVGTGTDSATYFGAASLNSATFQVNDGYAFRFQGTASAITGQTTVMQGRVLPAEPVAGEPLVYGGGGTITTATSVTNQLTAAQIATGVWQDATGADFTASSSIGKSLYTSGNAPGSQGGLIFLGTNTGTASLSGTFTYTGGVNLGTITGNANALTVGTVNFATVGSYSSGQSPATLILVHPTQKLDTDADGRVFPAP